MGQYLTELHWGQISEAHETGTGRALYRIDSPLLFNSETLGLIAVPAGFLTDGASVPRIPLAWWLTGGHGNRASVIHDWLLDQHGVTRKVAAGVFREALEASGAPGWRTWLMYAGVRLNDFRIGLAGSDQ